MFDSQQPLYAAGEVELAFDPSVTIYPNSMAVQLDGKILIGGQSTIRRVHPDGSTDTSFNPSISFNPYGSNAYGCAVQADGKIVIAGRFHTVNGAARGHVARLNADGTLDNTFNCSVGGATPETISVNSVVLQPDGKIIIAGGFFTVNGSGRSCIARLNTDGTLDTGFNPNPNSSVFAVGLQANGQIVIGGHFTTVGGTSRTRVARLNTDGTLDSSFNTPGANAQVNCITVQADQKIIIAGYFTTLGGASRGYVGRLDTLGALDSGFNPNANGPVRCVTLQAGGSMLVGGEFTSIGGGTRNRIARLNSTGVLDVTFNPNVTGGSLPYVRAIIVQGDGKIVIGGFFTTVGGIARENDARLLNDTVSQTLSVPSTSRVEWLRGGAAPEAQGVTFELSTDGGTIWTPLGSGSRIAGGWEKTGLSIPPSGYIRGRARTPGADFGGSSGMVEAAIAFGGAVAAPEIALDQSDGTLIADGGSKDFGTVAVSASSSLVFTVKNTGVADLTGLSITKDGPNETDFMVVMSPVSPVSGPSGSSTFTVQFAPGAMGARSAVIHIASNDVDESPYDIILNGTGTAPEIVVEQPVGDNIADGVLKDFGAVEVGGNVSLFFTIRNVGNANLTGIGITKDGTDQSDFTITSNPSSTVPGPAGTTTFTIQFAPTSGGAKTAALHISSNDADESPFDINLSGTALSFTNDGDGDGMNDASEFQLASLGFNYLVSQPSLVNTYYTNANGAGLYTATQVQALNVGTPLIQRNPTTGVFTLTIGVEKSTNLVNFSPFPFISPQTTINGQGKIEFQFTVPDNAAFFQLLAQ